MIGRENATSGLARDTSPDVQKSKAIGGTITAVATSVFGLLVGIREGVAGAITAGGGFVELLVILVAVDIATAVDSGVGDGGRTGTEDGDGVGDLGEGWSGQHVL